MKELKASVFLKSVKIKTIKTSKKGRGMGGDWTFAMTGLYVAGPIQENTISVRLPKNGTKSVGTLLQNATTYFPNEVGVAGFHIKAMEYDKRYPDTSEFDTKVLILPEKVGVFEEISIHRVKAAGGDEPAEVELAFIFEIRVIQILAGIDTILFPLPGEDGPALPEPEDSPPPPIPLPEPELPEEDNPPKENPPLGTVERKNKWLEIRSVNPANTMYALQKIDKTRQDEISRTINTIREVQVETLKNLKEVADTIPKVVRPDHSSIDPTGLINRDENKIKLEGKQTLDLNELKVEIKQKIKRIPAVFGSDFILSDKQKKLVNKLNQNLANLEKLLNYLATLNLKNAVNGIKPNLTPKLQLQVILHNPDQKDIGRTVKITVKQNKILGAVNTPLVKPGENGVALVNLQGKDINTKVAAKAVPASADFNWPANTTLTGHYQLIGNYGDLILQADYTDNNGIAYQDTDLLSFDQKISEERVRNIEKARHNDFNSWLSITYDIWNTILLDGLASIVNAIMDLIATSTEIADAVPVAGSTLDAIVKYIFKSGENSLQIWVGVSKIIGSGLFRGFTAYGNSVHTANIKIAECFPEMLVRDGREEVND